MSGLLKNEEKAKEITWRGHRIAEKKFRIKQMIEKIENVYENLIRKKHEICC
jgi:glycosyltransferase involved in cell wall biosynthesis